MIVPFPHTSESRRRVRALTSLITRLVLAAHDESSEIERLRMTDEVEAITTCLARAPSRDMDELHAKAVVLRQRMEEVLDEGAPAEALTLALAASLLQDIDRLAA